MDTQHVQWVATIADGTSVDRAGAKVAVVALWHDKLSKTDNARKGKHVIQSARGRGRV